MAKKISKSLWDEFDKHHAAAPKDSVTVHAYMERYGVTFNVAAYSLERGVASGKLKKGTFRTESGRPLRHYWLADK